MTTRNKRKLAALNKENCEEHPRSNLAQNSSAPRSQEDYITQVSEKIEGRVTKRLSKEFSRTENRILGALARLDDFLMNPLLPGGSGTTPEPTRNASGINQGTNEDDSQNDPHPEASIFHGQREQTLAQKGTMTLSVWEDTRCCRSSNHHKNDKNSFTTTHAYFFIFVSHCPAIKSTVFKRLLNNRLAMTDAGKESTNNVPVTVVT